MQLDDTNDAEVLTSPNPNNQNWVDLQPSQPYATITPGFDGDEGTDAGGTYNTLEKIYSGESGDQMSFQSYGYSLDDGIVSKPSQTPSSGSSHSNSFGMSKPDFDRDSVNISLGSPGDSSVYSGLTNEDGSLRQIMKPNKHRNTFKGEESDEEDPFAHNSAQIQYQRVCTAPPGKLGVIIDTTKLGPVVYQVKDGSPLQGVIFPGDRIIAIDEIDTTGMTASNITKIMARKADKERKITVSSKRKVN